MFTKFIGVLFALFSFRMLNVNEVVAENNTKDTNMDEEFTPRVINGWPAKLGDVPYQLSLKQMISRHRKLYATFCGAALVGPSKVVSAAHCFEEKGFKCFGKGKVSARALKKIMIVAGNLNNRDRYAPPAPPDGQWRYLKSMKYPKNYKFPKHDIAVGFTSQPFILNDHVNSIGYAKTFADYDGKCLASGYGRTGKKTTSEVLLLAHLQTVRIQECNRMHRKNMVKFVCTDGFTSDVAKGDSGGPLVCSGTGEPNETARGILVGIVSGHRVRVGSFFTRVSAYSKFINRGRGTLREPNDALIWLCIIYSSNLLFLYCFI